MEDRFESNTKFNKVAHLITGAVIHITVDYEEDKKTLSEACRENGCKVQFFENADEHMLWANFGNNNAITAEPSDDYQHVHYELTDSNGDIVKSSSVLQELIPLVFSEEVVLNGYKKKCEREMHRIKAVLRDDYFNSVHTDFDDLTPGGIVLTNDKDDKFELIIQRTKAGKDGKWFWCFQAKGGVGFHRESDEKDTIASVINDLKGNLNGLKKECGLA